MGEPSVMSGRGQITLPAALRKRLGLKGGDVVILEERGNESVLKPGVVLEVQLYSDEQTAEWDAETAKQALSFGSAKYPCPIPGCSKIFKGTRGGWDAHVGSRRKHPDWHPDVSDPEERKRIFRHEHPDWLRRRTGMSLPYDMGNAGDLLKHGVLAEFVRWQCERNGSLRFVDLFGGEPWSRPVAEVVRRVRALPGGVLPKVQSDLDRGCYYGSSLVVRRTAEAFGCSGVRVLADDCDRVKRKRLRDCGLSPLNEDFPRCGAGTDQYDGYAAFAEIIQDAKDDDLVLIDPFAKFLPCKAGTIIPQMAEMAGRAAVLLFALNLNPNNRIGRRFDDLLEKYLPGAWRTTCPRLSGDTGIRGESKYHAEVVLAARVLRDDAARHDVAELKRRLEEFTGHLTAVLGLPDGCLRPRVVG